MSGRQILVRRSGMKSRFHVKRTIQTIKAYMTQSMTKGLQCIIGRLQTQVFQCERINTAKQKDGLTSFLMLSVLEAKIFQYGFLEEHKMCVNYCY